MDVSAGRWSLKHVTLLFLGSLIDAPLKQVASSNLINKRLKMSSQPVGQAEFENGTKHSIRSSWFLRCHSVEGSSDDSLGDWDCNTNWGLSGPKKIHQNTLSSSGSDALINAVIALQHFADPSPSCTICKTAPPTSAGFPSSHQNYVES